MSRKTVLLMIVMSVMSMRALYSQDRYLSSDSPTVQAVCGNEDVMRYGKTWIYQQAPDLQPAHTLQVDNTSPQEKIRPKKSWELKSNFLGVNTSGMPRSRVNDYQPAEPVHLIDGDVQTCWLSRGLRRPEMTPNWVRIDFPMTQTIDKIVLKKRPKGYVRKLWTKLPVSGGAEIGQALPEVVTIEGTADNMNWTVLYSGQTKDSPDKTEFSTSFDPTAVKSVRVIASTPVNTESFGYAFSFSELEIFNTLKENIALVSKGAGIIASSTEHGRNEIDLLRSLWPTHGDAGFKWVRIGYHDDPINWHEVEKSKGVLEVDPMTDDSITELANMGLNIIMCLDFGNRLYTMPEEAGQPRPFPQLWEWYYDSMKPPTTPEALEAWDRFVEFIVVKYRDRVKYFEVWNEWNISLYWGDEVNIDHYLALARRTIPIIRRLAPDAKILVGSTSGFPFGCARWTKDDWTHQENNDNRIKAFAQLLTLVDIISWHPYYQPNTSEDYYLHYPDDVRAIMQWAKSKGFQGTFMNTEWNMSFNYPDFLEVDKKRTWCGYVCTSEMQKAKHTAQCYVQDAGLGMVSLFCELNNPFYGAIDLSLFRRSVDTDPVTTLQPEAAYYIVRNIATMTDEFQPESWNVPISSLVNTPGIEPDPKRPVRVYTFSVQDGKAIAVWFGGTAADVTAGVPADITLPFTVKTASALDPLNGVGQQLNFKTVDGKTVISGVLITDVPLIVKIRQ